MRTDGCHLERCYVKNNLGGRHNFKALDKVWSICDPNYLAGGLWQHAARSHDRTLSKVTSGQLATNICFGTSRVGWKRASRDQSGDGLRPREKGGVGGGGGGSFLLLESPKFVKPTDFIVRVCRSVWVSDLRFCSGIYSEHKIIWIPKCFYVYFVPLLCNDDVSTACFIQRLLSWWLSHK